MSSPTQPVPPAPLPHEHGRASCCELAQRLAAVIALKPLHYMKLYYSVDDYTGRDEPMLLESVVKAAAEGRTP